MKRHVDYAIENEIAVITIDSPPVNAFSESLRLDFLSVLDDLRERCVRAVIITGSGQYFQSGGDMNDFRSIQSVSEARNFVQTAQDFMNRIAAIPCPTIAAINGFALGGGVEIALACDIRLASKTAVLGLPEVKFGLFPGAGGTQRLCRLIGPGRAKWLMYTGRSISAEQALAMGVVEAVAAPERLLPESFALAKEIASNSPAATAYVKKCVEEGFDLPMAEGLSLETDYWVDLIGLGDYKEGVNAWFEKRKPSFSFNTRK